MHLRKGVCENLKEWTGIGLEMSEADTPGMINERGVPEGVKGPSRSLNSVR